MGKVPQDMAECCSQPNVSEERAKVCFHAVSDSVTIPHPLRLRARSQWWLQHAKPQVVEWVLHGVTAPWWGCSLGPQLPLAYQAKSKEQEQAAESVLQEYKEVGAVKEYVCPPQVSFQTFLKQCGVQFLVPWFIVSKPEGNSVKHRLIADCRKINVFFHSPHFKMEHWGQIFPFVRKGMWAAKIDLKHAYFHLPVHASLKPYLFMQVNRTLYQFQAAPFGLSPLPFMWTQVMKTMSRLWRRKGIFCFIYLDDILLLSYSHKKLTSDVQKVLSDLLTAGLSVNVKKSQLVPTQNLEHLGFLLDLKAGFLQVPQHKLQSVHKSLKKLKSLTNCTPRKVAAVLGVVRIVLMALPQLRAFTDLMLKFVRNH